MDSLIALDAGPFLHGSLVERRVFATALWDSLQDHGFARVVNHGVPHADVKKLFYLVNGVFGSTHLSGSAADQKIRQSNRFFELSREEKGSLRNEPGPRPQRGYSGVGEESAGSLFAALDQVATGKTLRESREHFDIGSPVDVEFPNRWPAEDTLPGFRATMEEFYHICQRTSSLLLEALEVAADLPAGRFTELCQGGASELRLNFYPCGAAESLRGDATRIAAHTDLGVITCLFQDASGGLEIEDRCRGLQRGERTFQPVLSAPSTNEMIVNVSETMQRWTNDRLRSGIHRVTLPPYLQAEDEVVAPRLSIPFFVKADRLAKVGALAEFIGAGDSARYSDVTALDYHSMRVAQAY